MGLVKCFFAFYGVQFRIKSRSSNTIQVDFDRKKLENQQHYGFPARVNLKIFIYATGISISAESGRRILIKDFSPLSPMVCAILPCNGCRSQFHFPPIFSIILLKTVYEAFKVYFSALLSSSFERLDSTRYLRKSRFCHPKYPKHRKINRFADRKSTRLNSSHWW